MIGLPLSVSAKEMPDLRPPYPEDSNGFLHQIVYLNVSGKHMPVGFNETGKWILIFGVIVALILLFLMLVYFHTFTLSIENEINRLRKEKPREDIQA